MTDDLDNRSTPAPTAVPPVLDHRLANIEDLRRLAERATPRPFFGYLDSGSFEELTLRANRRDLDALTLRQRVLAGVGMRELSTTLLGQTSSLPVAIAPTGLAGLIRADGELHLARAAEAAGVPFTLSTVSICSIEDVRAATRQPFWFQLYVMRDRGVVRSLIERAWAAQCSALMVTVDLAVQAPRLRDERNGMTLRPQLLNLPNVIDFIRKPGWIVRRLRSPRRNFGNLERYVPGGPGKKPVPLVSAWIADQLDPTMSWADLDWIRSQWPGKLIVKGLLDADDARRAVQAGADAIVVSNHGGRQLDGALSSIRALPRVAQAVAGEAEVLFDGGVRSGADVLKALASGARGALLGRAPLYGLAALGEPGVAHALALIRREYDVSLALAGVRRTVDVGPEVLDVA
ncbi:L-lactate dehydrogenase [Aquabacterium sp.]|uniref:alpha-hydroxy acid oxidase n=1 Tax=Aquabacterium sp. TaxID=1872578 RepID=UPI0035AF275C